MEEERILREGAETEELKLRIPCDWDSGVVRYRKQDGQVFRIFVYDRNSGLFKVADGTKGAAASGLSLRFAEALPAINFG